MPSLVICELDTEIAGTPIARGDLVALSLPAANRDPRAHADGDRLDVTHGAPGHLAFGHGVHHCLGAPLARMEMRIAFPALLAGGVRADATVRDLGAVIVMALGAVHDRDVTGADRRRALALLLAGLRPGGPPLPPASTDAPLV